MMSQSQQPAPPAKKKGVWDHFVDFMTSDIVVNTLDTVSIALILAPGVGTATAGVARLASTALKGARFAKAGLHVAETGKKVAKLVEVPLTAQQKKNVAKAGVALSASVDFWETIRQELHDDLPPPLKKPEPLPGEVKLSPTEQIKRQHDFRITPGDKKLKFIRPLQGVVTPYIKIGHLTSDGKPVDLCFYLQLVSISWDDTDSKYISSFTMTCVYKPELMRMEIGFEILPFIGTHYRHKLSLGEFHLARRERQKTPASDLVTLVFSAINYKNAVGTSPVPQGQEETIKTYRDALETYAKILEYELDVSNATRLDEPYDITPWLSKTGSPLHIMAHIVRHLNLTMTIAKKTIIIQDLASTKNRIRYFVELADANSFFMRENLQDSYDQARIVSDLATPLDPEKNLIEGMAKLPDKDKDTPRLGRTITRYRHVTSKEEAEKQARILLTQVNSSVTSCTLSLPNTLVFAGHDIIIDNRTGEFEDETPLKSFRIRRAHHVIDAGHWECTLELDEIQIDDQTKIYEDSQNAITALKDFTKAEIEFLTVARDYALLLKATEQYKGLLNQKHPRLTGSFGELIRTYDERRYPSEVSGFAPLVEALKKFKDEVQLVAEKLGAIGFSLQDVKRDPEDSIAIAFREASGVAIEVYAPEDEKEKQKAKQQAGKQQPKKPAPKKQAKPKQ